MAATKKSTASKSRSKKTATKKSPGKSTGAKKSSSGSSAAKKPASKSSRAKKTASKSAAKKSATKKSSTAKKSTAKKSAAKRPAKKSAAKKTTSARSGAAKKTTSRSAKSRGGSKTAASKGASKKTGTAKSSRSAGKKTATKTTQSRKRSGNGKSVVSSMMDRVTGLFGGKGTDAIELLKADHDKVEQMFEKVKANEDGDNKATFKKIKLELDTHTHIEETIFYPYLLEHGDKELEKIVREGIEEHRQAKMFLVEMDSLPGGSDDFKAKMKVLMEDIEHHVKEEENEMFKMTRDQVEADKLQELGARMEAEKPVFQKNPKTENAPVRATANA